MKTLALLMSLFLLISCSDDDETSSSDFEIGDIVYANGSTVLGAGFNASGTANTFLDCRPSGIVNKIVPKNFLLAFGIASQNTCGNCNVSYRCNPGDPIDLSFSFTDTAMANPTAFEMAGLSTYFSNLTCPQNGIYTENLISSSTYVKIRFESNTIQDTEYLICSDL